MAVAPHIKATVSLTDELTSQLIRTFEGAAKLAGTFNATFAEVDSAATKAAAQIDEKLSTAITQVDAKAKTLGETIKASLSPAAIKEAQSAMAAFKSEMAATATAAKDITFASAAAGMQTAAKHSSTLRENMRQAAEMAKVIGGFEAAHLTGEAIKGGAEYGQTVEVTKQVLAGQPGEAEIAIRDSQEIAAKYPQLRLTDVLENRREFQGLVPNEEGVDRHAHLRMLQEETAKLSVIASIMGSSWNGTNSQDLLKVFESTGRIKDMDFQKKFIDRFAQFEQLDASSISSERLRTAITNAKTTGLQLSDDFLLNTLMPLVASGQAPRIGNELSQFSSSLIGGRMTKAAAQWFVDAGLADSYKNGGGNAATLEGLKGSALAQTDPFTWASTVMLPGIERMMKEHGATPADLKAALGPNGEFDDKRLEAIGISGEVLKSNLRSTVTDLLSHMIVMEDIIKQQQQRASQMPGVSLADHTEQMPLVNFAKFTNAIATFSDVVTSGPISWAAAKLGTLGNSIASFTQTVEGLPEWERNAMGVGVIGGGAALTTALVTGFTGLFNSNTAATIANTEALMANTLTKGVGGVGMPATAAAAAGAETFLGMSGFVGKWGRFITRKVLPVAEAYGAYQSYEQGDYAGAAGHALTGIASRLLPELGMAIELVKGAIDLRKAYEMAHPGTDDDRESRVRFTPDQKAFDTGAVNVLDLDTLAQVRFERTERFKHAAEIGDRKTEDTLENPTATHWWQGGSLRDFLFGTAEDQANARKSLHVLNTNPAPVVNVQPTFTAPPVHAPISTPYVTGNVPPQALTPGYPVPLAKPLPPDKQQTELADLLRRFKEDRADRAAKPEPISVSGEAKIAQQTTVTVELGQKTTALIQKAIAVPLTRDMSGVAMAGSQGAVTARGIGRN